MNIRRFLFTILLCLTCSLNLLFYLAYTVRYEYYGIEENRTSELEFFPNINFDLNHPKLCDRKNVSLIVVVTSGYQNFQNRHFIRTSWGLFTKNTDLKTEIVFLVGKGFSDYNQKVLEDESKSFGDIIQGSFLDTYRNLTLKSVAALKWITSFCSRAKFVLKIDDDVFVNIPNLIEAVTRKSKILKDFIIGSKITGASPVHDKNSKWYTPGHAFPQKYYPTYVSGTAYALTISAAKELYLMSSVVKPFWLEDIYITGLCAQRAGIPRLNHYGFSYFKRKPTGCSFREAITGHHVTGEQMRHIYREVTDVGLTCR